MPSAKLREMELRHLRYFVAVAEALSFTKAAEKLRLAQPSLTRQIRNLEDEIGVKLLDRSNNRIDLTEEGRRFLFDAKKLLALCAESVAAVQGMNSGEKSELNIGYISNLHYGLLPATLGAFRKLYPRVALNLFDMTSAEQLHALAARKLDLGFVASPLGKPGDSEPGPRKIDLGYVGLRPELSGHDLLSDCVAYDTILVALPAHHPLASKPKVKLSDIVQEFFTCMSEKVHPGERAWLLNTCQAAGFKAKILQQCETELTAIKFVADGLGVALLPEQITKLPHEGTVFLPLAPPLRREATIAWRADNPSEPLKDYIQIVKELSRGV
jgi:DNA-binding transcriptional LysR family regulator